VLLSKGGENLVNPGNNGHDSRAKSPGFIGKDKVAKRRAEIVADVLANPNKFPDVEELAAKYNVSVRTIRRDMQSDEIVLAVDQTVEESIDGLLIHKAWANIRKRIIEDEDVDLSVWLVNHRSKQANDDRLFEQFQQRLAREFAETMGQTPVDFDPNEFIGIKIKRPTSYC